MSWLYRALGALVLTLSLFGQVAYAAAGTGSAADSSAKTIVISLSEESLTAYENGVAVLQTPVTTGGPYLPTPVGTYTVLAKRSNWTMRSPWAYGDWRWYPDSFINYSLLFQWTGYFIHDASWRSVYGPGSNQLIAPFRAPMVA